MNSKSTMDLCNGPLLKKIIAFTVPVIFSGLLQLTFSTVDMIVIGRFCGSDSLAAVGATGALTNLIVSLFLGLSVGSSVSISHAIGSRNKKEIDRVLHTSVLTAFFVGLILMVIGLFVSKSLLRLMGTPSEIIDKSAIYLKIIFIGMPINMLYNYCAGMLRSSGDSMRPLIYLTVGGVANLFINIFLVTVIRLDVIGVAIGTVLSQLLSLILTLRRLICGTEYLKLKRIKMHMSRPHLFKILKIGIPSGLNDVAFNIANTFIQSSVNIFGPVAIAANSAAASIEGFTCAFTNLSQTSVTFIGQNMGARKYDRILKTILITTVFGIVIAIIFGYLTMTFGENLLSIYCPDSPDTIKYGMVRLRVMVFTFILSGLLTTSSGVLRGMGYSFLSMLITLIGILGIRMAWLSIVFNQHKTLTILYMSYPVSQLFIVLANFIAIFIILKKLHKKKKIIE